MKHKQSRYVKEKSFPVLHRFNIPLEKHWISGILRDIARLSRDSIESDDILRFQYSNQYSSMHQLVNTPLEHNT